jgi:hypothetical protein
VAGQGGGIDVHHDLERWLALTGRILCGATGQRPLGHGQRPSATFSGFRGDAAGFITIAASSAVTFS